MMDAHDLEAQNLNVNCSDKSLNQKDDTFPVDFVLAYKVEENEEFDKWRERYKWNLHQAGLKLQDEKSQNFEEDATMFLKIYAPVNILSKQADILGLKKPVKFSAGNLKKKRFRIPSFMKPKLEKNPPYLKVPFREDISQVFLGEGETLDDIFTSSERIAVVWEVLLRTKFGDEPAQVGIRKLLNLGTYSDAFPLHDGSHLSAISEENKPNGLSESTEPLIDNDTDRQKLFNEWARPGNWYKAQPLELIRKYYGDEIGIYFAWVGFYTKMLIPASIVGLACFIYGLSSTGSKFTTPTDEICNESTGQPGTFILCPNCLNGDCPAEILGDSCFYSQLSYLFDNPATVAFAIFMSFWATMFLEFWKREQAKLNSKWGLTDQGPDMESRPEFDAAVTTTKVNPFTGQPEPSLPGWNKFMRFLTAMTGVAFMVLVVAIAFLGIIVYKIAVSAALYATGDEFLKNYSQLIASATGSFISLVIIVILSAVYKVLARWLTDIECHRTQTEYETSYTFKIFVFEFVNYYSLLIYIAFFKGKFYTYPGDDSMWTTFFGLGGDQCDPAGCVSELFIQLIFVMVGKQILYNVMEIGVPFIRRWLKNRNKDEEGTSQKEESQLEKDYKLSPINSLSLFNEFFELVLQYGFLTLFVAVFPLAPLFALINNVLEIRIDSFKMTVQQRRSIPKRVTSLGAWFNILQTLTYIAVIFNAFIVAFTSEFIPQLVYILTKSPTGGLEGYIDFTLSVFAVKDYNAPEVENPLGITECRYKGFRYPPDDVNAYEVTQDYWNVLAARLAFVVVFEHVVMGLTGLMASLIPDLPWEVKEKAYHEEKMLAEQTLYYRSLQAEAVQEKTDLQFTDAPLTMGT